MKHKFLTLALAAIMALSMASMASAAWSSRTALDIPGWNSSKISDVYAIKTTDDSQCTFETFSNEAWGLYGVDGRLVNSENQSRSNWVRNMHTGSTLHAATTAVKNHYYWAELSTDALEPNEITVSFRFSPDFES